MNGLSVIIPGRMEKYMAQTVYDAFSKMEGDFEIIAIYDGCNPDPNLPKSPKIKVVHNEQAIGQRQAVNQGAELAQFDYILKADGHTMFDQGFDRKLIDACEPNWTVLPRMYNLDAEKWAPKLHKKTDYMWFRSPFADELPLRIQYWDGPTARNYPEEYRAYKKAPYRRGKITEVMNGQGACFFMPRAWFFELGGMDIAHGHWGQMGVELACKTWLHGGKHMVNKNTWFSHMFRSAFPWPASGRQQERARKYSINLWSNNKWPGQIYPLSWLIEKFGPIPTWTPEHIKKVSILPNAVRPPQDRPKPIEIGGLSAVESTGIQNLTLLYYTANVIDKTCQKRVLEQIKFACPNAPMIIVHQGVMERDIYEVPGKQIQAMLDVGDIGRSLHNIYKQVLTGLREVRTEYVALVEDDCLYTPEHFTLRPKGIGYNFNRWCLHADDGSNIFSYRKGPVLSQCIARTKVILECLQQREGIEVPKKYCGEPGVFEGKLGLKEYGYEELYTDEPNVVICHKKNTSGRKYHGKDGVPAGNLPPWGNATRLINKLFGKEIPKTKGESTDMAKFGRGSYKRNQHSYIGSIIFNMDELLGLLPSFARKGTEKRAARRIQVFPQIVEKVASLPEGQALTDKQLMEDPCYQFFLDLHHNNTPEYQKKRSLALMREWKELYEDIRDNGLKEPLDFWREGTERLVFWRGWRRLFVMNELNKRGLRDFNKLPCRVYKNKRIYQIYNAPPSWTKGPLKGDSIHSLAQKQFGRLSHRATDKFWVHRYTVHYDKHLTHLREKPVKVLEIGVLRGASLLLWREAFPKGKIYGVDKNTRIWQRFLKGKSRVKVFVGRQEDKKFLNEQVVPAGPYDIIIDDGGHSAQEQIASFESLWPMLNKGGIYVMEDCHRNLWPERKMHNPLMIDRFKELFADTILTNDYYEIHSISCYYNIVFLEKNR